MKKQVASISFKSYVPDSAKDYSTGRAIAISGASRNLRIVYTFEDGTEAVEFFNPSKKFSRSRLESWISEHARFAFLDASDISADAVARLGNAGAFDKPLVVDVEKENGFDRVVWKECETLSEDETAERGQLDLMGTTLDAQGRAAWNAERAAERERLAVYEAQRAAEWEARRNSPEGQKQARETAKRKAAKKVTKARKRLETTRAKLSTMQPTDPSYDWYLSIQEREEKELAEAEAARAAI